jgi:excisionase family DNA binding protein
VQTTRYSTIVSHDLHLAKLLSDAHNGARKLSRPDTIDGGTKMERHDDDALLTPSEVAEMFRVNPKTVTRWARAGKISAIRTLGGHRRFRASEIRQCLGERDEPRTH